MSLRRATCAKPMAEMMKSRWIELMPIKAMDSLTFMVLALT